MALETAVPVQEGDLGMTFHEGGNGRAGEGAVTLDNNAIYLDERNAHLALALPVFFVFWNVDNEGIAFFFDKCLLFGHVECGHF